MIGLKDVISEARCLAQIEIASKKRVLEEIAEIASTTIVGLSEDSVFSGLVHRESLGSTGFGNGIAIPHCRLKNLEEPIAIVFTLTHPVPFDAIDNKGIDIVFALLVPEQENEAHLSILGNIAELLEDQATCQQLRSAYTGVDIFLLIQHVKPASKE